MKNKRNGHLYTGRPVRIKTQSRMRGLWEETFPEREAQVLALVYAAALAVICLDLFIWRT